jgi:TusE/DsrC/DsvC family sulfur relay protein
MPVAIIGARQVHVDADGFVTRFDDWDDEVAGRLAAAVGLELTEERWEVIRVLREDYPRLGETPCLPRVAMMAGTTVEKLRRLFPEQTARTLAFVAGLPKPHGC